MVKKYLIPGIVGLVVILITGTLIAKCARNKDPKKHNEVRLNIINKDILETATADKYRKTIDSLKLAVLRASNKKEYVYFPVRQKAQEAVKKYEIKPTIENCSNAVVLLKTQTNLADSIIRNLKQVIVYNDTTIASYKRTVSAKDKSISQLNAGYEKAIEDLKQAKKPKRFGLGIQAGGTLGKNIKPTPYVGIGVSYNIIRF